MNIEMIAAAINPQRLGDGSALLDRTAQEATKWILFAFPYVRKAPGSFRRVLDNLKKNCGAKLAIDSGGYELAVGTAHGLDPVEVVNLQNSIADIGWILDHPPDKEPFDKCLKMTVDHVKAASTIEKKFEYYLVVHGRTMDQIHVWYEALRDVDTYQGISVSGIEFSELLRGFIFVVETPGWRNWHFLGTSSIVQISLIHYLSRKLLEAGRDDVERITFDSSTPTQFGKACRTLHPIIPLEVIIPRNFDYEFLRNLGSDFDGSASSAILTNVKSLARYNEMLGGISASAAVAEFVEVLFPVKMRQKWGLGKKVIDTAFECGTVEALKLIPPELDRVKGLRKKGSVLSL